jgi:taurine---2-oxoglutarate transaminase
MPLHITDAESCYFIDGNGKRYLDLSSQLMCLNLGHKNQAVIEPLRLRREAYLISRQATQPIPGLN